MDMEYEQIEKLLKVFDDSSVAELKLETEGVKLVLRKASAKKADVPQIITAAPLPAGGNSQAAAQAAVPAENQPAAQQTLAAAPEETDGDTESGTLVTAPLAGIFYRSPKPGEKPYVEVGTEVKKGQTIGLMEAMKIINEIPAPCDGTVKEILAADGEFAQFEAPLLRIE